MKRFFYRILYFSLPIALLIYPCDIFISNSLKESKKYPGEYEVWNAVYNGDLNTDIAIYGSSIAWVQINPKILKDSLNKEVYNFGIDGNTFLLQYLRHLEYIEHNSPPKHIVFAVNFNTFNKSEGLYKYEQFLPYMLWNENIKQYTQSYKTFKSADYYIPLYRYFGKTEILKESFKSFFTDKTKKNYRVDGYRGVDKKWTNDFDNAKKKMSSFKITIHQEALKTFKLFLADCIQKNIKVTLVYTPEYIEGQYFIEGRDQVIELYHSFANEYKINFIDYSQNSICFKKDLFYNTTHLNIKGSELFSSYLARDLLELEKTTNKRY